MEIKFKRDTAFRKTFFVPDSFAHPAKMDAQLLIWIVENYTKPDEVILDPMAGSGTMMLACTLGRHCILVELEGKFCKMMRDNWELVKMRPQLGYSMGNCQIIQGDARQLEGLLVDRVITSPPYAETDISQSHMTSNKRGDPSNPNYRPSWKRKINEGYCETHRPYADKIITSPPFANQMHATGCKEGHWEEFKKRAEEIHSRTYTNKSFIAKDFGQSEGQIGNLPYGNIDSIITSPPYEKTITQGGDTPAYKAKYGYQGENIGYSKPVDSIITSPPYDESIGHGGKDDREIYKAKSLALHGGSGYGGRSGANIGDLKGGTYLEAMLQVYQQCYKVLKPQGLMILVTKNFIRNKQIVRLDEDTIKLCEQAGFSFIERLKRKLPSQSFWRVIYHQKHPEVEQINYEDVLVFAK